MAGTPDNEQDKIREIFDKYDKNDNDTIEWDEFCVMIDELMEIQKTLEEKCELFKEIDTNKSGMISLDEFTNWWEKK